MMPHTPLPQTQLVSDDSPPNLTKTNIALFGQASQLHALASMQHKLASNVKSTQAGIQQTYMEADHSIGSMWIALNSVREELKELRADFDTFVELFKKNTSPMVPSKKRAVIGHTAHAVLTPLTRRALARRAVTGSATASLSSNSPSEDEPASATTSLSSTSPSEEKPASATASLSSTSAP